MKLKNIVYVLFLILIIKEVSAIGISPGDIVINFEPNFSTTTIEYSIVNTMDFEIGARIDLGGPLSQYMNLSQTYIESIKPYEVKKVTLTIQLPESINEPGLHRHTLSVVEQRRVEEASGMVARGGVIDLIDIWVLSPEKYPKAEFTADDASINDTAKMNVRLWNYGKPAINFVSGYAEIMDLDGKVIHTVPLSTVSNIQSFEVEQMTGSWSTLDAIPSIYNARAVLNADGKSLTTNEDKFKVGELKLKLLSHTQRVYKDQINEFVLFVENNWNHGVEKVYAQVFVKKNGSVVAEFQTINYDFLPWEKRTMEGFLNTAGLEAGSYEIEVVLKYLEIETHETRSIDIIKKPVPTSLIMIISANALLVVIVIIIVIIVIMRKKPEEKRRKQV